MALLPLFSTNATLELQALDRFQPGWLALWSRSSPWTHHAGGFARNPDPSNKTPSLECWLTRQSCVPVVYQYRELCALLPIR